MGIVKLIQQEAKGGGRMNTFEEFHDGFVDGFLIQKSTLKIYLSMFDQRKIHPEGIRCPVS